MHTRWAKTGVGTVLLAGLLACLMPVQAAEVKALRVWAGPEYTRAVFDVSGPLDYKLFDLADPARLVLDLRASSFANGFGAPEAKGLLKAVRSGRNGGKDVRVVFDLTEGVRAKSFLLPPAEKFGYRLVLDLYPQTKPAPIKTVQAALPAGAQRDVLIMIDAGHGGDDPGSIGAAGTYEKNITLAVARELKRVIDKEPGMAAMLTRDADYFIPHKQRYQKARDAKADLFVSVHADSFTNSSARGSSVWVLSPRGATSEAARWLADRENRADLVGGVSLDTRDDTLAAVLLDLSQGATMEASNAVAGQVHAAMRRVGPTHKPHVERANFVVLRSPDVPSILVETAFISNPAEEKRLNDPNERTKLAEAIVEGVRNHFRMAPPPGTLFAANARRDRASRHVVSRGETLGVIAARHGLSVGALRNANKLASDNVRVGDVLEIPQG
ncbi:N-acetylmuramoyl-L-alanine amidase [Dokdonella sp.]|uniref:N-acetylmuramoyl-L-alanine amidase n=1 Tax=Dokdonella sp. TaxID=2291710 RepID=UPI0025BF2501|nr:N-acetylmuramoyl-L-alanine amidase [Dokdonella sp.]MBX3692500.1 N-acetylmuramoyl-L-alanine amidase [Dokdonella sp.]MCW5567722.1 N-acetylmuramoyl-L-alanine amidase [Dokdonella sp.]